MRISPIKQKQYKQAQELAGIEEFGGIQWEYSVVGASASMDIVQLNAFGEKGWELVHIGKVTEGTYHYTFKRVLEKPLLLT